MMVFPLFIPSRNRKGAVYNVYAAAEIVSADGTVIYKKDALVKAGLTTGDDGSATLDNLYLGKYVVKRNAGTTKSGMHW